MVCVWRLCKLTFESGTIPKNWRTALIAPLLKGKGKNPKNKGYRGTSLFSVDEKRYAGLLEDKVRIKT